jgi:hypothetical protein
MADRYERSSFSLLYTTYSDLAATYAALILADEDIEITVSQNSIRRSIEVSKQQESLESRIVRC